MKLIRTFHPVGQGAFYTEKHFSDDKEFNIVYDCGSLPHRPKYLQKIVNSNFVKDQTIDILFISHFHADHINGIDFLKNQCKIKKVVIPYINDVAKVMIKVNNYLEGYTNYELIDDPTLYFGPETTVITINPTDENRENPIQFEASQAIDDIKTSAIINSGIPLFKRPINDWFFVPFNYLHKEREKQFLRKLKLVGLKRSDINTLTKIKKNEEKIKKAYSKIDGGYDLNINSLVLYSGKNEIDNIWNPFCDNLFFCNLRVYNTQINSGCLYMGDVDMNQSYFFQNIRNKLLKLLPYVGTIQIPHHGAIKNYNSDIFKIANNIKVAIISFGLTNTHGHPSDTVISDLIARSKKCFCVTEDVVSLFSQWK